jgi:hypothetical protein
MCIYECIFIYAFIYMFINIYLYICRLPDETKESRDVLNEMPTEEERSAVVEVCTFSCLFFIHVGLYQMINSYMLVTLKQSVRCKYLLFLLEVPTFVNIFACIYIHLILCNQIYLNFYLHRLYLRAWASELYYEQICIYIHSSLFIYIHII